MYADFLSPVEAFSDRLAVSPMMGSEGLTVIVVKSLSDTCYQGNLLGPAVFKRQKEEKFTAVDVLILSRTVTYSARDERWTRERQHFSQDEHMAALSTWKRFPISGVILMAAQMEKNKQLAPYKSNQDLVNGSSAKLSNICASQHVHICINVFIHYACMYMYIQYTYVYIYVCIYVYIHAYIFCIFTCVYIMFIYIRVYNYRTIKRRNI